MGKQITRTKNRDRCWKGKSESSDLQCHKVPKVVFVVLSSSGAEVSVGSDICKAVVHSARC